jgi:hypothetical protein
MEGRMKATLADYEGELSEIEINVSILGIDVGPFFIYYEDGKLNCQINDHVEFWSGDLTDPLTDKLHIYEQNHPDDTFTIRQGTV